jgi:hypothetical protein
LSLAKKGYDPFSRELIFRRFSHSVVEAPMRSLLPLLLVVALHPDAAFGLPPGESPGDQSPASPLSRADVTASIGSFGAKRPDASEHNDWTHSLFAGIGGGYYWTDHLKTEVDVSSGGRAEAYSSESAGVPESPQSSIYLEHAYQSFAASVGQSYQFGRNAQFHPFVVAGVDIEHLRHAIERPAQTVAVYTRNPLNPQAVQVVTQIPIPALTRTETAVTVSPYAAAGFKAYFTERAFFRTDLKVNVRSGIDRVIWRAGFGADF